MSRIADNLQTLKSSKSKSSRYAEFFEKSFDLSEEQKKDSFVTHDSREKCLPSLKKWKRFFLPLYDSAS